MRVGDCPSCRAPVEFAPGAGKIKVCEYCNTVVLRGEANLQKLGKVAELVDTDSPLKLGLSGRYQQRSFTIVGRLQKSNGLGTWDEWCLAFEDERQAWLSESEGQWNIMLASGLAGPDLSDELKPLAVIQISGKPFTIEEVNQANTASAQGQLPEFSRNYTYVEATGTGGAFVSLEYAGTETKAEAFIGHTCTLNDLGFDRSELQPTPKRETLHDARCTQCNGMLALKAPDATKRVACPFCGALLSVQGGKLEFLELLEQGKFTPLIPLGSKGTLDKAVWVVIAYLRRSCEVEGTKYPWEEYLLWNQQRGFTWLMNSNNHWTWLKPIAAGEVTQGFRDLSYNKTSYREFQRVYARTDYVVGECYWEVSVGELAKASEFIAPPSSVNFDETDREVSVTLGTLMPSEEIQKAFALKQKLQEPTDIAPAQPNPWAARASEAWQWSFIWAGGLLLVAFLFWAIGTSETYLYNSYTVPPGVASGSPDSQIFTAPFTIKKKVPLEVTLKVDTLSNDWFGASVDLVNQDTGEVISVYGEAEYYSGVTDGESWSEGSHSSSKQTDEVDKGTYVARITPQFAASVARPFDLRIQADDGPGFCCPLVLLLLLFIYPVFCQMRSSSFETRKWNEAVFQTSPGVSSFPYAKVESDDDDDSSSWSDDD